MVERRYMSPERPQLIDVRARANHIVEQEGSSPVLPGGYLKRVGTVLLSDSGKDRATMSFSAYHVRTGDKRPIAFCMSGGPIAPTTGLMEYLITAPWIVGHTRANQAQIDQLIIANHSTPLTSMDLVHIDAVGTGFGRVLSGEDPKRFFGMQQDVAAFVAGIEGYVQTYGYESNPRVLIGASFSGLRATGVALELQKRKLPISAMSFLSGLYDYALKADQSNIDFGDPKDPRIFATYLPVMALTAQMHNRLRDETQRMNSRALYREVWDFASKTYLQNNKDNLSSDEIIQRLIQYIGVPKEVITEDLRITIEDFQRNLVKAHLLSSNDSRFTRTGLEEPKIDPALDVWTPVYESIAVQQLKRAGFPEEDMHEGYSGIIQAYPDWDFSGELWRKRSVHRSMKQLLEKQPNLPIMHISGMYDLNTPPSRADLFWDEVGHGIKHMNPYRPSLQHYYQPSIYHYLLPVGHLLGVDPFSRQMVGQLLRDQGELVTRLNS